MPPEEGALLRGVWPVEKHCKAYDFEGCGKRVSCAKTDGPILTMYTSYEVFLRKQLSLGVAIIAPMLKFLVALIF